MVGFRLFPLRWLIASHDVRGLQCNMRAKWDVLVFSEGCGLEGCSVIEGVRLVRGGFLRIWKLRANYLKSGDIRCNKCVGRKKGVPKRGEVGNTKK